LLCSIILCFSAISSAKTCFAETAETIYIRVDGSIEPPTAPISTLDNVAYLLTGNITSVVADGIVIERNNIIFDGGGCTILGRKDQPFKGIDLSGRSNVTIQNTNITNFSWGIWLSNSSNNSISGSKITNNSDGIHLQASSDNIIYGNNMANNEVGINLGSSSGNSMSGNNLRNNNVGIHFFFSSDNNVSGNDITANNNLGISLYSSSGNGIFGNYITENNWDGVEVISSSDNNISENNVRANYQSGIVISTLGSPSSSNNSIVGNNITDNAGGIRIYDSAGNSISGNNITANSEGIKLGNCLDTIIVNNDITDNDLAGIWHSFSNSSLIFQNRITRNLFAGIILDISSNNSILENDVRDNHENMVFEYSVNGGVALSSDNRIFHNNFVNGDVTMYFAGQPVNFWDDGYPSGGNYWSDYNGTDNDYDDIGDTVYVIDANNIDHYPLMAQYVIPEFSSFLILPMFLTLTLLAVIVYKMKQRMVR
jgi:parallel beta-helix repeat protein